MRHKIQERFMPFNRNCLCSSSVLVYFLLCGAIQSLGSMPEFHFILTGFKNSVLDFFVRIREFLFCAAAKVPPHAFTIQQLPSDGQSATTCRLVSPGSQPLSQQQQQHPRSAVPPGSQIIPIQPNTVFLTSNCLSSTALPAAALSIPVTSIESRQPNEQ